MLRSISLALVGLALLGTLAASRAHASNVVALIVGINNYADVQLPNKQIPDLDLTKAVADATAIRNLLVDDLKVAAANVIFIKDGTRNEIMIGWQSALAKLQQNSILLVYFAGHGIELRGHNFLVPRDVKFDHTNQGGFRATAIDVQHLLAELAVVQEKTDAVGVFILDACRENPFQNTAPVGGGTASAASIESGGIGLAPPLDVLPRNVFMMYSAGIGQKALDGGNGPNSVFTAALLALLKTGAAKTSLADLAQSLRYGVYLEALQYNDDDGYPRRQTPAYYDQLLERYSLLGEKAVASRIVLSDAQVAAGVATRMRSLRPRDALIECSECPEMVLVPQSPGRPRIAVGKFEVTRREWQACVDDGGKCTALKGARDSAHRDREPVSDMSWTEAQAYVAWLSQKTGQRYRLPTQAEWEHAARAGGQGDRPPLKGGETLCDHANGADRSLGSVLWTNLACDDKVGRSVTVVGRYRANAWGFHDMLGNVWEWAGDCDDGKQGAAQCSRRIAKGGSWRSGPEALRFDNRIAISPAHRRPSLGLRVVREMGE